MSSYFYSKKYVNNEAEKNSPISDASDALAQAGYSIGFYHPISCQQVYFKAFLTAFNETFNSEWASEQTYGRMDAIHMFKNTSRRLTVAFKIPASTTGEAYENLARVQTLIQFLYPSYTNVGGAQTIAQSPLVRLKIMNMVQNQAEATAIDPNSFESNIYDNYLRSTNSGADKGLLGWIGGLTVNHNLENTDIGSFELQPQSQQSEDSQYKGSGATILPKMIEINFDFTVIHEHPLGWTGNKFNQESFPYNAIHASTPDHSGYNESPAEEVLAAPPAPPSDGVDNGELNSSQANAQNAAQVTETPNEQGSGFGEGVNLADIPIVAYDPNYLSGVETVDRMGPDEEAGGSFLRAMGKALAQTFPTEGTSGTTVEDIEALRNLNRRNITNG
jgi:hypothetical protein